VELQDYYGNQGLAEYAGSCQVMYAGSQLTLPELGRVASITIGTSTFQLFEVQGPDSIAPCSSPFPIPHHPPISQSPHPVPNISLLLTLYSSKTQHFALQ